MIICPKCNKENEEGSLFCESCGTSLKPKTILPPHPGTAADRTVTHSFSLKDQADIHLPKTPAGSHVTNVNAVQADAESSYAPEEWTCTACRSLNGQDYVFCKNCGTHKPEIHAAPGKSDAAMQPETGQSEPGWNCRNCGVSNPAEYGFCQACKTPKSMKQPEVQKQAKSIKAPQQKPARKRNTGKIAIASLSALIAFSIGSIVLAYFYPEYIPESISGLLSFLPDEVKAQEGSAIAFEKPAETDSKTDPKKESEKEAEKKDTPKLEYRVMTNLSVYEKPSVDSKSVAGLKVKDHVLVGEIQDDDQGSTWARVEAGWVEMSDGKSDFLAEVILEDIERVDISVEYEPKNEVKVYPTPSRMQDSVSVIAAKSRVTFKAGKEDAYGNVWHKTSDDKWVLFKTASENFFEKYVLEQPQSANVSTDDTWGLGASTPPSSSASSNTFSASRTGTYKTLYIMKIRENPNLSAEQVGRAEKGDTVNIVDVSSGENGSLWGKLSTGNWICIYDNELQYLEKI